MTDREFREIWVQDLTRAEMMAMVIDMFLEGNEHLNAFASVCYNLRNSDDVVRESFLEVLEIRDRLLEEYYNEKKAC